MKKIPEIRFPEFSGEWVEKRLEEIGKIVTGTTPSTKQKNYWNGNILFVTPLDIQENKYISNTNRKISKEGLSKTRIAKKGSVLFVCIGSTIGKVAIVNKNVGFNQQINAIFSEEYNNELLYYVLLKKSKKIALLAGEQAVPIINKTEFSKIKIHIPPTLDEQKKIADFLSSVDEKIEIVSKKLKELKKYKKGLLQKLLNVKKGEPELRFKGFSGKWVEKRLGEVIEERNEKTTINNQYPILTSSKEGIFFQEKYFSKQTASETNIGYKIVYFGDFTYRSMSDTGHFTFNIQNLIERGIVSPAYPVFKVIEKKANSSFIYYSLNYSTYIKKQILILRQGGTRLALNLNKLKQIKIHLPPTLAEQEKIASFLSSIDEKIELNEKRLQALKKYKQGLLQKMFI